MLRFETAPAVLLPALTERVTIMRCSCCACARSIGATARRVPAAMPKAVRTRAFMGSTPTRGFFADYPDERTPAVRHDPNETRDVRGAGAAGRSAPVSGLL